MCCKDCSPAYQAILAVDRCCCCCSKAVCLFPRPPTRLAEDFQKAEGLDLRKDRQALQVRTHS